MSSKPRIGITCDYQAEGERCSVRRRYAQAVMRSGGIPFILPQVETVHLGDHLDLLDGVVFTGGNDYHPRHFGQEPHAAMVAMDPVRECYDLAFFAEARRRRLPILGICGGMQLAAIHFGARLVQDLPTLRPGPIDHRVVDFGSMVHAIQTVAGSRCARLFGASCQVNSLHHQAVDETHLPAGLTITARADDGVVEAIEVVSDGPFDNGAWFMGVQWHPEWLDEIHPHGRLFADLVAACRTDSPLADSLP